MSDYQQKYPHLCAFFGGAFSANSGGHTDVRNFKGFTEAQLGNAEYELAEFCSTAPVDSDIVVGPVRFARWLGMMADDGYTIWGQTKRDDPDAGDDEQHKLQAFTLLDSFY